MIVFDIQLKNIPRVGEKYAKKLEKMHIQTVRDLLFHFPFRYDDYSLISSIAELRSGETFTVMGIIRSSRTQRTWKRKMFITEIELSDETGSVKAVWFNQSYLADQLIEGKTVRLSGKISAKKDALCFSNPSWERAERDPTNTGRLVPVYQETEGLTSRWLRWQIQLLLKNIKLPEDPIPADTLKKMNLPTLEKALHSIHFPRNLNQALVAQKRFAFQEMLLLQIQSLRIKELWAKEKAISIPSDEKMMKKFVDGLPFRLTSAQKKSAFEIHRDLEKDRPMNRLLNGDVGSGKTVVAAIAALGAINKDYQVAIMAPTEVLARQHFDSFCKLFENIDINIALLTGAYKLIHGHSSQGEGSKVNGNKILHSTKNDKKNDLIRSIKAGESNLIIGTHALIQEGVRFKNLALIIVDEQHRFGVSQRAYLQQKATEINDGLAGKIPHFLTMTATPIPRTLALAFFGNLDLSVIDEMPNGRKKIITKIVPPSGRNQVYQFIKNEIKNGRQCYVILPLVEESKVLTEVKAATEERERLAKDIFPELKLGLIHGKLKAKDKEKVMHDFKIGKLDILVATAVVEVGVDVPNTTVMIIEDADRFGLAQLHQFRGRIGRGEHQSYCFLFSNSSSKDSKARLKALVESEDGFKIAEKDLELRGPGEFLGTRQSGLPDIAMENINNVRLIKIAREEAQEIMEKDPGLKKHPLLLKELDKFNQEIHME